MNPSAASLCLLLFLTASASLPKFVVPNFPDLTIKTRRTFDGRRTTEETLYLKGASQRSETVFPQANTGKMVTITQCDQKVRLSFNEKDKTYASFPIEDWSERMKRARPLPQSESTGKVVNVTIDSVDTGERRPYGNLEAHRVKTTTKVEPDPGAVMKASVTEVDGWYIDLPGLGCQESRGVAVGLSAFWAAGTPRKNDRIVVKTLGTAPRGYPLEEISRRTEEGRTTVSKVELLEFSQARLADSLFDLPAGYVPALRTPNGGQHMTKPDSFGNRLEAYWEYWTRSAGRWFHSIG